MVLAFVGAGVITMPNALAVILGANLGTTLDSWIVALAGFKLNIENIALPVAGIAGIGYAIINKQTRWHNWYRFLLGFSFLFIGLGYMKTGIEELVMNVDLKQFQKAPVIVFFVIGFIITTLIQSSSATIAITLSALNAGALTLYDASAIVLGSEIGTTIKLFLASLKGAAAKRRVALGNFMFNTINVTLVLIFLFPLNDFITGVVGIKDNLIALVFFQTLVNIIGIVLFYPALNVFTKFLENRFKDSDNETLFIYDVSPEETSTALMAMEKECRHFLNAVLDFSWSCFEKENRYVKEMVLHKDFTGKNLQEKYAYIKFLHGEIHSFYIQVQKHCSDNEDLNQLDRLISAVRNTVYAAKSIKDAIPDIEQFRNSSNDIKFDFYKQISKATDEFCIEIYELMNKKAADSFEDFKALYHSVTKRYNTTLHQLYKEGTAGHVNETEITTLLNFNREISTFYKSLLFGVKDYLYETEQAEYFEELPGFIR
jgi:phosphate:Na+ symporter